TPHGDPPQRPAGCARMSTMRNAKWFIGRLLSLALTIACIAGLYNVFSDNSEVAQMAQQAACGDDAVACRAQMTAIMRTPIGQSFDFATTRRGRVHVSCSRAWIFFGAYACTGSEGNAIALQRAPGVPVQSPASSSRTPAPPLRSSAPRQ